MARNTIKERLEAGLTALGWRKEQSGGARVAGWTHVNYKTKIFVGDNGGFRAGQSKSQSHSVCFAGVHPFYTQCLVAGDKALAATPQARHASALDEFTEAT